MDSLISFISTNSISLESRRGVEFQGAILGLLLSFVLGQFAAWIYIYTHSGVSYSRTFVQSIVLLTILIALGMMVIGSNIAIAFGLIGALAVIRFRNVLKDTRDTAFIFFSLVIGMACGTGSHKLAVLGALVFCIVVLYLHFTSFGSRHISDGFIRFQINNELTKHSVYLTILKHYCRKTFLISQRFHDNGIGDIAYRLSMRDPAYADEMVDELKHTEGISNVTFVLQEEQAEI